MSCVLKLATLQIKGRSNIKQHWHVIVLYKLKKKMDIRTEENKGNTDTPEALKLQLLKAYHLRLI